MFLSIPLILLFSATVLLLQLKSRGLPLGRAEASLSASIQLLLSRTSVTSKILENFPAPLEVEVACNPYVVRDATALKLHGVQWTAGGANVYWLGLDENVIPPATLFQIQHEVSCAR